MDSQLIKSLKTKMQPVAVILTNEKPSDGLHFKEGARFGCVASLLVAASRKNRVAFFDRNSFGCPGGGTGLGFGDRYGEFPIDCLLSTGNKVLAEQMGMAGSAMEEGERFYRSPEITRNWVNSLPFKDVPTEYVLFKPWDQITESDEPEMIIFFANADQLSALVILADYNRGTNESVTAPFGAACQSILFGYEEAKKENPRAIIGFFDISQRKIIDRETLTVTIPYKLFREMESSVRDSFLDTHIWHELQERQ